MTIPRRWQIVTAIALGAASAMAVAVATPAAASGFKLDGGGDLNIFGRDERISRPFIVVGSGVALPAEDGADPQWSLTSEIGWARGKRTFIGLGVGYLALAPTIDLLGGPTELDLALLAGVLLRTEGPHARGLMYGAAVGVDARLFDERDLGLTFKLHVGFWWVGAYVQATIYRGGEPADGVARGGLEFVL